MEMKKCKECGKLFMPKSMRSQYCDDLHYRPCPVCGKKVEAKYLSDPPRCCSKECQQVQRQSKTTSTVKVVNTEESSVISTLEALGVELVVNKRRNFNYKDISPADDKEIIYDYEDELQASFQTLTYIGKPIMKFEPGHVYAIDVTKKPDLPYEVSAVYDFTEHKSVELCMPLSSKISICQKFSS